jgi:hypothetical protein
MMEQEIIPYRYKSPNDSLTDMKHSTTNLSGEFSQICETHIRPKEPFRYLLPPFIIRVDTGTEAILNPIYNHNPAPKKNNRGRKPKTKKISKRAPGGIFESEIQFCVLSHVPGKPFKIKCFKTGKFQIPGVRDPYWRDAADPLYLLMQYFQFIFELKEPIRIVQLQSIMTNMGCQINLNGGRICLNKCHNIIEYYKNNNPDYEDIAELIDTLPIENTNVKTIVKSYLEKNRMDISLIVYNAEENRGVKFRVARPAYGSFINPEMKKKTREDSITVEILQSAKIGISGGKVLHQIEELYEWVAWLVHKYKDNIIKNFENVEEVETDNDPSSHNNDISLLESNMASLFDNFDNSSSNQF